MNGCSSPGEDWGSAPGASAWSGPLSGMDVYLEFHPQPTARRPSRRCNRRRRKRDVAKYSPSPKGWLTDVRCHRHRGDQPRLRPQERSRTPTRYCFWPARPQPDLKFAFLKLLFGKWWLTTAVNSRNTQVALRGQTVRSWNDVPVVIDDLLTHAHN